MDGDRLYLRPEIKLEPLVARWPAWPHLLAPATHAMNMAYRHLPNLKSFVANPSVHLAACRDPAMLGGPFVALPASARTRVQELIKETMERGRAHLTFAEGLRALHARLQSSARGYCLDDCYADLAAPLAGAVELTYDVAGYPKVKLMEEMLDGAVLDSTAMQEVCLHPVPDREREFFMSTPALEGPDRFFMQAPLADRRFDVLARARTEPVSWREVTDVVTNVHDPKMLRDFFTDEPPVRNAPSYEGEGIRVRYFGHACVLLQTANYSILMDPLTAWQPDGAEASFTFTDLPDRIDLVILSHCHQDHLVAETLLQLRTRVGRIAVPRNDPGNLADPSMKLILRKLGFQNIDVMDTLDTLEFPGGRVTSLPFVGEHAGLDISSKHCLAIEMQNKRFLFLVDSEAVDPQLYRRVAARVGRVDVLFLGMECHGAPLTWLYGPLLTKSVSRKDDESRRLSGSNCDRAWSVVEQMGRPDVYVYAMGQEPWLRGLMGLAYQPDSIQLKESDRFIAQCQSAGLRAQRLYGCQEFAL